MQVGTRPGAGVQGVGGPSRGRRRASLASPRVLADRPLGSEAAGASRSGGCHTGRWTARELAVGQDKTEPWLPYKTGVITSQVMTLLPVGCRLSAARPPEDAGCGDSPPAWSADTWTCCAGSQPPECLGHERSASHLGHPEGPVHPQSSRGPAEAFVRLLRVTPPPSPVLSPSFSNGPSSNRPPHCCLPESWPCSTRHPIPILLTRSACPPFLPPSVARATEPPGSAAPGLGCRHPLRGTLLQGTGLCWPCHCCVSRA